MAGWAAVMKKYAEMKKTIDRRFIFHPGPCLPGLSLTLSTTVTQLLLWADKRRFACWWSWRMGSMFWSIPTGGCWALTHTSIILVGRTFWGAHHEAILALSSKYLPALRNAYDASMEGVPKLEDLHPVDFFFAFWPLGAESSLCWSYWDFCLDITTQVKSCLFKTWKW